MRRIAVVITARASYSRFRSSLQLLGHNPNVELHIILAASAAISQYGEVARQMEQDGLLVSATIPVLETNDSACAMGQTTGKLIIELSSIFEKLSPDAVVTIADRYETIATAIAATYQNLPLIHIQGGEVSGNIDDRVRHAISKLADIHLVSTQRAKEYLIRMGELSERIIVTGCPSCDLAALAMKSKHLSQTMIEKYIKNSTCPQLSENNYYVLLVHGVTDEVEKTEENMSNIIDAVSRLDLPVLWISPNVDPGANTITKLQNKQLPANVHLVHALDSVDFLELLRFCRCIIGNSSVGIRECSFMGVPAVNIGTRQIGRERGGNVIDVDNNTEEIFSAILKANTIKHLHETIYGDGKAGERIAHIIATVELKSNKTLTYING